MYKYACPWVIIDFVFEQQQPKLGRASFNAAELSAHTASFAGLRTIVKHSNVILSFKLY